MWSKYDSFYYIFWTADPLAIKLGLIYIIKSKSVLRRNWIAVKVKDTAKSKCQWMFVQTISYQSLNCLQLNLVWWCVIMDHIVFPKELFAVFKVKITVKDHIIQIWLSNISSEVLILFQLNLIWWHIIVSWIVFWKDWIALLWSRSQERFKIPVNIHLDISSTAEPFVT